VNWHLVDIAVRAALLEETGHPVEAVGGGGSARASESIALVSKGPDIAVPSRNGVRDRGVALAWFIDP
jgi:hypothetical protein